MGFDAFKTSAEAGSSKLEMKAESFTDGENQLGESVSAVLDSANNILGNMTEEMKNALTGAELKAAHLAMEQELEDSIPAGFATAYERAGSSWQLAANLVTAEILSTVQDYVNDYLAGGRPKEIEQKVDKYSWFGGMGADDLPTVFERLGLDRGDIAVAQAKWKKPNSTEQELAQIRRKAEEGNLLEQGWVAIKNPNDVIRDRMRKSGLNY